MTKQSSDQSDPSDRARSCIPDHLNSMRWGQPSLELLHLGDVALASWHLGGSRLQAISVVVGDDGRTTCPTCRGGKLRPVDATHDDVVMQGRIWWAEGELGAEHI
jgi:hypothetical protein